MSYEVVRGVPMSGGLCRIAEVSDDGRIIREYDAVLDIRRRTWELYSAWNAVGYRYIIKKIPEEDVRLCIRPKSAEQPDAPEKCCTYEQIQISEGKL